MPWHSPTVLSNVPPSWRLETRARSAFERRVVRAQRHASLDDRCARTFTGTAAAFGDHGSKRGTKPLSLRRTSCKSRAHARTGVSGEVGVNMCRKYPQPRGGMSGWECFESVLDSRPMAYAPGRCYGHASGGDVIFLSSLVPLQGPAQRKALAHFLMTTSVGIIAAVVLVAAFLWAMWRLLFHDPKEL